jgi:membrane-associated protease RseP (regulator of RpoE activity)
MKTSKLSVMFAILLVMPFSNMVIAADFSSLTSPAQMQANGGYLGVLLEPVPNSVRAQLGSILPSGEGVMVLDVVRNSPAAKAKLEVYDILIGYNEQKIFSAEQLSHLVRAESPGKMVKLRLVRNGTSHDIQLTLGEIHAEAESVHPRMETPMDIRPFAPFHGATTSNWESFDSMTLKKLKNGDFKAEIQYFDKDGKFVKRDFTGTSDVILEQIIKEPDMPAAERNQLFQALIARDVNNFPTPNSWIAPSFFMPSWFNWRLYF